MSEQTLNPRRSPRALLAKSGHPGAGPGTLTLVLARAGEGKTAFVTSVGLDALLAGETVLHVSTEANVDKVRDWYDDLLAELAKQEPEPGRASEVRLSIERRRHILGFLGGSFTAQKLQHAIGMLGERMDFHPQLIVIDRIDLTHATRDEIQELKSVALGAECELWASARLYRSAPGTRDGHLPNPAEGVEDLVDLAFRLVPEGDKIRLHALKDNGVTADENLNVLLDPKSLLLVPEE